MKTLNTQLASWTQLRHDTILYSKQSYTDFDACVYPTGYVEPRVEFWKRFKAMASAAAARIAALNYMGTYSYVSGTGRRFDFDTGQIIDPSGVTTNEVSLATIQNRQLSHLQNFATIVGRLEALAEKELAHESFTSEDEKFIDGLIEENHFKLGCGGAPSAYNGWYPQLFYRTIYWTEDTGFHGLYGSGAFDGLVADVHTDVPNVTPPDPGSVLHEAVGRVNLLMIAVDNGADRFVCAGPVMSHYEFEVIGAPRRLNDNEWRSIQGGGFPADVPASRIEGLAPPVWTQGYLVR